LVQRGSLKENQNLIGADNKSINIYFLNYIVKIAITMCQLL
jgi:hypothetical protein